MAFEGTKQGMRDFLAAKQAGSHPLAQHLNFKSALKEARIAMAARQLEAERQRGFTAQQNQLQRETQLDVANIGANSRISTAQIKAIQSQLPPELATEVPAILQRISSGENVTSVRDELVSKYPNYSKEIDAIIFGRIPAPGEALSGSVLGRGGINFSAGASNNAGLSESKKNVVRKIIKKQRSNGLNDADIKNQLIEAGINPAEFGL